MDVYPGLEDYRVIKCFLLDLVEFGILNSGNSFI